MRFHNNNPVDNIMLNIMDEVIVEKGHIDYNTQLNNAMRKIWLELEKEKNWEKRLKNKKCYYRAVQLINNRKR